MSILAPVEQHNNFVCDKVCDSPTDFHYKRTILHNFLN